MDHYELPAIGVDELVWVSLPVVKQILFLISSTSYGNTTRKHEQSKYTREGKIQPIPGFGHRIAGPYTIYGGAGFYGNVTPG